MMLSYAPILGIRKIFSIVERALYSAHVMRLYARMELETFRKAKSKVLSLYSLTSMLTKRC